MPVLGKGKVRPSKESWVQLICTGNDDSEDRGL